MSATESSDFMKIPDDELRAEHFLNNWNDAYRSALAKKAFKVAHDHPDDDSYPFTEAEFSRFWDEGKFHAKRHVDEYCSHKKWVLKTFDRLGKRFFPNVTQDQIDIHDYSKVNSFEELAGYTDRWVWKVDSAAWKTALDHHYEKNPHHPQYWKDNEGNFTNMELPYLEESIIDMIACGWERQLKGNEEATLAELATMDDKYLIRYTDHDRKLVREYLEKIIAESD